MSLPRYPAYKDSGVEWLGLVPKHWALLRLRRCVELNPSKAEIAHLARDISVSFLPMEAVGEDGSLDLTRTRLIQEVETGYTYFRDGDVGFAKITPCFENGKGALMRGLAQGIGFGTTELTVLRANHALIASKFLAWIVRSPAFRSQGEANMYGAGGQKRVPDDFVRELLWGIPPLGEQEAIASFLDRETAKIDALIAEQEKLIALLAEKRQATIFHAVTRGLDPNAAVKDSGVPWLGKVPAHWRVGKAGFYVTVIAGYAFPSTGFTLNEDGVRLLRGVNVGVGELRWDDVVFWNRSKDDGLEPFELQVGDVVVGMDRPLISTGMRVATVRAVDVPCLLLQRVAKIQAGANMDGRFIMRLLSSRAFEAHFSPETTGVSVPHISADQIANFIVPIPPRTEQQEICDFLDMELRLLDGLNARAREAIGLLQERRSALIAAAVTGQIDVRSMSNVQYAEEQELA